MPDPLDLDALDRQHHEGFVHGPGGGDLCLGCWLPWPCPTSVLIGVVRRQNEALVEYGEHDAVCQANAVYTAAYPEKPHPCDCELGDALARIAALVDLGEPT